MRSSIGSGTHHGDSVRQPGPQRVAVLLEERAEALQDGIEQALVVAALDADVDRPRQQRGDVDLAQAAFDHPAEGVLDVVVVEDLDEPFTASPATPVARTACGRLGAATDRSAGRRGRRRGARR